MAHLDLQTGTYAAAETLLHGRDSRRIGHNTTLHTVRPRLIAVRYHSTDIVTLSADGWLTMRTGGWDTVTTWQRINALLPGYWSVWSNRGTRSLYHNRRAITPYADGLSLHVGYSSGAATGAVGMNGQTLLTAEDVAAIESAAETAETIRADKRAARLLREHPTVNGPRTHTASLYQRRAHDCARCNEELAAERAARMAILSAEHVATLTNRLNPEHWSTADTLAAGSHVTRETVREYPPLAGAAYAWQRDYKAEPTVSERVKVACPWECPDRPRNY